MSNKNDRYYRIQAARSPAFDQSGTRLSFVMHGNSGRQIWATDKSGGWPEQWTFGTKRVVFTSWSPVRNELIFGADTDGTEKVQLYRLQVADSGLHVKSPTGGDPKPITKLTHDPAAIHRWGGWSNDGERFAFTANRRSRADFDIYVQTRDNTNGDPTLVSEGNGLTELAGWSPTDESLLVRTSRSKFDHTLHSLSLDDGTLEQLTPEGSHTQFQSPQWGPDGESVYCVTDYQRDKRYFARIDPATTVVEPILSSEDYCIESVAISRETGKFVAYQNADGYTELVTGELDETNSHRRYPEPKVPNGVAGAGTFDSDGHRFAVPIVSSTTSANLFVISLDTGEAERWTDVSTAGIPPGAFQASELVRYSSFDSLSISALFSLPSETANGDTPAIIDIHGGPRSQRRPGLNVFKQQLLSEGYAVLEPNIRGSSGYGNEFATLDDGRKRMDAIKDIKAAVSWLRAQPSIDTDRIGVIGTSYGGFVALSALYKYPDLFAAGVSKAGIVNIATFLENTSRWRRERREEEYGSLEENREYFERISPLNNLERIDTPVFIVHGKNDPRVPVSEAVNFAESLGKSGKTVDVKILEDEGHSITRRENRIEVNNHVIEFLNSHLL
ncbi:S9 family peptidase [Halomontanus rarus]|uniref:S9 family peptidase n=1 Tax=Halomontanus rarus TaxID=3034020 RepID=UPI0023E7FF94|nr:S9 family peptidase [Halovivax sp. TS33]